MGVDMNDMNDKNDMNGMNDSMCEKECCATFSPVPKGGKPQQAKDMRASCDLCRNTSKVKLRVPLAPWDGHRGLSVLEYGADTNAT